MREYVTLYKIHETHDHVKYKLPVEYREEIVRCRDCKHYYEADNYHPKGNYIRRCCNYFDTYNDEVTPDGFCAWGVKEES